MLKIFGAVLLAVVIAIIAFAWIEYNNKYGVQIEEGVDNERFEEVWKTQDFSGIEPRSERQMLDTIHKMSNTIIKAVDGKRWGLIKITEDLCNQLILETAAADRLGNTYEDTEKFMEILWRWKDGDFSEGVEEHNYVWRRLGGTVGKAYDLQNDVKTQMIEKGFYRKDR